CARDHSSFDYW
nr:immunoglobulin heavy chain junction region [Macaca mulatta]